MALNMTPRRLQILTLLVLVVVCGGTLTVQAKKRRKHAPKPMPNVEETSTEETPAQPTDTQVRLRLVDGTAINVDDAWESEQGFWYRQGGITYLVQRDRVKGIERGAVTKTATTQIVKVTEAAPPKSNSWEKPAWIYLKGGARVEADSAFESEAGVWYRRGPLSVFLERSRVEKVELEEVELAKQSESSSKKELGWSTGSVKLDSLIKSNGTKYGVDPYLIFCVMEQESGFNSRAVSPKGARGLMQLMPGTGARFGVRRPHDAAQNISGGTRYLKELMNKFNGRVDLVLASYNAGEGAVIKYGHRVPPYRETRNYVKKISYRYRRAKATATPASTTGAGG
jgi:soluble lytic murein transglycosylase-like protein